MGWDTRNLKPGPNGSPAGMGDSIVLRCGHTWGYTAYWDSGDPTGCRAPDTTHGTPGRGPARAYLDQRRSPGVGSVRPSDRVRHGSQLQSGPNSWARTRPARSPGGNCQHRGPNRPDEPRQEAAPSLGLPDLQTRLAGEMDARTDAASGWSV